MTHGEAGRAVYIDVECLATRPFPTPALLGVLTGDAFEQCILDPQLAPARVANARSRVAQLADVITDLVDRAEREDRMVVGWSFFDRDVAMRGAPLVATRMRARYRNAIQTARPWRQHIHPSVRIVKENEHAAKHTLDKYAVLARYDDARVFARATPARWIRHTIDQLAATGGRYRHATKQARRDWHTLLEYNHHDCLAVRHITLKATKELEAWRAYQRTQYCVDEGARCVCFRVGSTRTVHALLERHGAKRFAFITAWNPGSIILPPADNDRRQARLEQDVAGYTVLQGTGVGDDPSWTPEKSLMVLNISRGKAIALAREHGQLAIVWGTREGAAQLVSCR